MRNSNLWKPVGDYNIREKSTFFKIVYGLARPYNEIVKKRWLVKRTAKEMTVYREG